MKELMDEGKLTVIPIFYKVEPHIVAGQRGEFGDKLRDLGKLHPDRINQWTNALTSIASVMGITVKQNSDEITCIEKIVVDVKEVLDRITLEERENPSANLSQGNGEEPPQIHLLGEGRDYVLTGNRENPNTRPLFGIERRLKQLEEILDFACEETRIVGIIGMPGIGKTTLAKKLFRKWKSSFTSRKRLQNIPKMSNDTYDPRWLRKKLLEKLLKGKNLSITEDTTHESVKDDLLERKVLIVLDDVSDKKQIKDLLGDLNWVKKGSKIVITTSDKTCIRELNPDTYLVPRLNDRDGFNQFSYFAFEDHICPKDDEELMKWSRAFVYYARGHPSALRLLGLELRRVNKSQWENKLKKFAQSRDSTPIRDILTNSFNALTLQQKDVFLDVACFFRSEEEYYVRSLLDSRDPDSADAVGEIRDLAGKFLIDILGGRVEMHDLLNMIGMEISSQARNSKQLRLWNCHQIATALTKKSGKDDIRGIFLDMSEVLKNKDSGNKIFNLLLKECLGSETFKPMSNLRYLKIYDSRCPRECRSECSLKFPDGLEFTLAQLRYLHWLRFPMNELPRGFDPKNLIELKLPYSKIQRIWSDDKKDERRDTSKLKWVDLSYSSELCNLSGLSGATNLQSLNLEGCTKLCELPPDMKKMNSLSFLNLKGCTSLKSLQQMNLSSLKTLILSNCSKLEKFDLFSKNLETLYLDGTAIETFPLAIGKLQTLVLLSLKDCTMLKSISNDLRKLKSLQELILSGCSKLESFPDVMGDMKCLQVLLLNGTSIKEMPTIKRFEGLGMYESPRSSTNGLSLLRHLCLSRNDVIRILHPNISQLYHLKWLDLKYCKNLRSVPELPPNLECLDAHGCETLKTVASPLALLMPRELIHTTFIFTNCNNLELVAKDSITSYAHKKSQIMSDSLDRYNGGFVSETLFQACFPGCEVPSWFSQQSIGSELTATLPPPSCNCRVPAIAVCAVVSFQDYKEEISRLAVKCTWKLRKEDSISFTVGGWAAPCNEPRKIESDHVFIGFNISKLPEKQILDNCAFTEASFEFRVTDGRSKVEGCEVLKCGLSFVYVNPNDVPEEPNHCGTPSKSGVSYNKWPSFRLWR